MSNYHNSETADGCSCGPGRSNKLQLKKTGYKRTKHNVKRKKTQMKCFFVTIKLHKLHAYSKELMANMQLQYCMNCDINTHYLHPFLPHSSFNCVSFTCFHFFWSLLHFVLLQHFFIWDFLSFVVPDPSGPP